MHQLAPSEIAQLLLSVGVLLALARILGEAARRFNQPTVLGELLAGILLGPTVLGAWLPDTLSALFPTTGHQAAALEGLTIVAVTMFLFVAGLEVNLSVVWQEGRAALTTGTLGIVVPFAMGLAAAWLAPAAFGQHASADPVIFALFFATALSISALPVIARIMMDLNLFRSDFGMIVIAAAALNDLIGWIVFATLLAWMRGGAGAYQQILPTVALTLGFAGFMLTAGRWLIDRSMPWVQAHASWPAGQLGLALSLAMIGAAFTEWAGVHAIFGAFLVGVALGDSKHLREQTREVINQFVSSIFAPLFFATIGLKVNFVAHFDWQLTLMVLVIACIGKVVGCGLGARLGGMNRREAWAVGFAMNARGAMEIILGLLALENGLIGEQMFVALVIMAMGTSIMSGPIMQRVLQVRKVQVINRVISAKTFINPLRATERFAAIRELAHVASGALGLSPERVGEAVCAREHIAPTGLGNRIAVPHARLEGLTRPVVAVGVSETGIDFDAPDGDAAQLIFLIVTPLHDSASQIEILADIARTFRKPETRQQAIRTPSYTEFCALLNAERT